MLMHEVSGISRKITTFRVERLFAAQPHLAPQFVEEIQQKRDMHGALIVLCPIRDHYRNSGSVDVKRLTTICLSGLSSSAPRTSSQRC